MKEMIYKKDWELEVLDKGEYAGRKYLILSLGVHPTAYVEVKGYEQAILSDGYDSPILDDVAVYCGFTFYGTRGNMGGGEGTKYLGWDYGHGNDFAGIYLQELFENDVNLKNLKKWTTAEIFEDVKSVIEQLNEVFEKAKNNVGRINPQIQKLLTEFDEMGFAPTTLCDDPDQTARSWKESLMYEINLLLDETITIRTRAEKVD